MLQTLARCADPTLHPHPIHILIIESIVEFCFFWDFCVNAERRPEAWKGLNMITPLESPLEYLYCRVESDPAAVFES